MTPIWYTRHPNSAENMIIYNGHDLSAAVKGYIRINQPANGQCNLIISGKFTNRNPYLKC